MDLKLVQDRLPPNRSAISTILSGRKVPSVSGNDQCLITARSAQVRQTKVGNFSFSSSHFLNVCQLLCLVCKDVYLLSVAEQWLPWYAQSESCHILAEVSRSNAGLDQGTLTELAIYLADAHGLEATVLVRSHLSSIEEQFTRSTPHQVACYQLIFWSIAAEWFWAQLQSWSQL